MADHILSLRPSRASLSRHLETYINYAHEHDQAVALLLLRVQRGPELLAVHGYRNVERFMEELALRLGGVCRNLDRVIRTAEFEVALVLREVLNDGHSQLAAAKALRALAVPFEMDGNELSPVARIGIAMFPEHSGNAESLMQVAEFALTDAEANKQPYRLYTETALNDLTDVYDLEKELDAALHQGEFEIHYQPKLNLRSHFPVGAEALLRWRSPKRGLLPPDAFLPVATRSGQLKDITWATLNIALEQAAQWPMRFGPLSLAVNLSPTLLDDESMVSHFVDAIALWGSKPHRLIVEVTESAVMSHPQASFETLRALRAKGMGVAIDDFGTGYSSLANFRNIPATELKVDKSFVLNMLSDKADASIVATIIGLGKAFELKVTAEGAESLATVDQLAHMGCDFVQGYSISPPLPNPAFMQFIQDYVPMDDWTSEPQAPALPAAPAGLLARANALRR